MTRFQKELKGAYGPFWQKEAEKSLENIKAGLNAGTITIDSNGVARNSIGRALMDDLLEQLAMVTDKVNTEATQAARNAEVEAALAEYRRNPPKRGTAELRATFGAGTTVADVITGERIKL